MWKRIQISGAEFKRTQPLNSDTDILFQNPPYIQVNEYNNEYEYEGMYVNQPKTTFLQLRINTASFIIFGIRSR